MKSMDLLVSAKDKRNYPRVSCKIPGKIRTMDPEDIPSQTSGSTRPPSTAIVITDLSLGGAFMECAVPMKEGKLCHLQIDLPKPYSPMTAFAEVRWTTEKGGGVQFLAIQEERLTDLKNYLQFTG